MTDAVELLVNEDLFDFGGGVSTDFKLSTYQTVIEQGLRSDTMSPECKSKPQGEDLEESMLADESRMLTVVETTDGDGTDVKLHSDSVDVLTLPRIYDQELMAHLDVVDDPDSAIEDDEGYSRGSTIDRDRTYQVFLNDAAESTQIQRRGIFPKPKYLELDTLKVSVDSNGLFSASSGKRLIDSLNSSFNFPRRIMSADAVGRSLSDGDDTLGLGSRISLEDAPVNRGVKLITSGSSIEQSIYKRSLTGHPLESVFETSKVVNAVEEYDHNKAKTNRRSREATINHNDFGQLETGQLELLFHIESPEQIVTRKYTVNGTGNATNGECDMQGLVSLYAKDLQKGSPERQNQSLVTGDSLIHLNIYQENPERWGNTLTSAFELNDDILCDVKFEQANICSLLSALDSVSEDNSAKVLSVEPLTKIRPTSPIAHASAIVVDMIKSISGKKSASLTTEDTNTASVTQANKSSTTEEDTITTLDPRSLQIQTVPSEVTVSPAGTMTAMLLAKDTSEKSTVKSLFQERIQSTSALEKSDQADTLKDWTLNNRFVSPPLVTKRRNSIKKIFFTSPQPSVNPSKKWNEDDRHEREDKEEKPGSIISLKSLWRSRTLSLSRQPQFNLESGASLSNPDDFVLPEPGQERFKGFDDARKMLDGHDTIKLSSSRDSNETGDTLTSLMDDKFRGFKSVSEHAPTPAPVISIDSRNKPTNNKWFRIKRLRTPSHRKRVVSFKISDDNMYINESDTISERYRGEETVLKRTQSDLQQRRPTRFRSFFSSWKG